MTTSEQAEDRIAVEPDGKEQMMNMSRNGFATRAIRLFCGLCLTVLIVGCGTTATTATSAPFTRPTGVRALDTSGLTDQIDRDRVSLARFVGAWDFDGWYDPPGEARRTAAGLAAGTIDHDHFVLIDSARVVAQADDAELTAGCMLLSAEPGVGLMLTAWSTDSPGVHRFRGRVEAEGSRFVFDEIRPARGNDHLRMVMRFETDDRWVAEFFRPSSSGPDVIAASYTFDRAM